MVVVVVVVAGVDLMLLIFADGVFSFSNFCIMVREVFQIQLHSTIPDPRVTEICKEEGRRGNIFRSGRSLCYDSINTWIQNSMTSQFTFQSKDYKLITW